MINNNSHQRNHVRCITSIGCSNLMHHDITSSSLDNWDNLWEAFKSMVYLAKGKVRTKRCSDTGEHDIVPALEYLMSREDILELPVLGENFEKTLSEQRKDFMAKSNLTAFQYDYAAKVLAYIGDFCAKHQEPWPLTIAWRKLMESGVYPRENTISTYMYALSLDDSTSHLSCQAATFHDLLFAPNEKTIHLRIKAFIAAGDATSAEILLQSLPNNDWTRLRTYLPILTHYCEKGDLTSVLRIYRQMRNAPGVHFDPETYAMLVGSIAENGGFRNDFKAIEGAKEVGFTSTHGPRLFDEMMQDIAKDILELNSFSVRVLYNAFIRGFKDYLPVDTEPLLEDNDLKICNELASDNEFILSRVAIEKATGTCKRSGTKLKLFQLDSASRQHVQKTLLSMAKDQFVEFQQKAKQKNPADDFTDEYPIVELQNFVKWLNDRDEHFTAIVDGANIAYYGHGIIKYSQIQHVVTKLEAMNERPLVVMPFKYLQSKFQASMGVVQSLSEKDVEVIDRLELEGKLYRVPRKCLDDYYWMMASVVGGDGIPVDAADKCGRFPGLRPMLITNDKMRDHKLELLEPRLFRRWYSCHIVNYSFPNSYIDEWEERPLEFYPADVFSREIQGNPTASSLEANDPGFRCWHFPVSEWDKHERFCIRVK